MKRLAVLIAIACAVAASAERVRAQGASQDAVTQPRLPRASQSTLVSPIGHRQPRLGDLPPADADNPATGARIAPEDAEMERRMKGICRGC